MQIPFLVALQPQKRHPDLQMYPPEVCLEEKAMAGGLHQILAGNVWDFILGQAELEFASGSTGLTSWGALTNKSNISGKESGETRLGETRRGTQL